MGRRRRVTLRGSVAVTLAVAASALLSGCTSPSVFPVVLAEPPPRNDTPLSPEQVRQATADLISERDRLCAEATADEGRHAPAAAAANCNSAAPIATGTTQPAGAAARP